MRLEQKRLSPYREWGRGCHIALVQFPAHTFVPVTPQCTKFLELKTTTTLNWPIQQQGSKESPFQLVSGGCWQKWTKVLHKEQDFTNHRSQPFLPPEHFAGHSREATVFSAKKKGGNKATTKVTGGVGGVNGGWWWKLPDCYSVWWQHVNSEVPIQIRSIA